DGGHDQADDHAEDDGTEKIEERQKQSKRQNAEDGNPDDVFAPDSVAHRAADDGARGHGAEKNEKMELSVLQRHVEFAHQVKRVIAHQAGQVEKLRKHQSHEDGKRQRNFAAGQ